MAKPQTIRDLRNSGWQRKSVKQEMRDNLIARLRRGEAFLPGIVGYDDTVVRDSTGTVYGTGTLLSDTPPTSGWSFQLARSAK